MKYSIIGSGKIDLAFTIGFGSRERNVVRRDLNPHGPFKPCGFSYRLRLSPPGGEAFGGLTPGLRSGLSLHRPPEAPELRCCPSSLYTFPVGVSTGDGKPVRDLMRDLERVNRGEP